MTVFESICSFLNERNIPYRTVHHEPTLTSEASALARGEEVKIGGKAIVMKVDDEFKLFVISASLKIDTKKIKQRFKARNARFATKEELFDKTALVPGSVPPFGGPILDLELCIDPSVLENDKIAFNAGSLTDSIIMQTADYAKIHNGTVFDFSAR